MTHVILGTVAEVTAPLRMDISQLRAWQAIDARKIKRLCAVLVRAEAALRTCGVGEGAPICRAIRSALKET